MPRPFHFSHFTGIDGAMLMSNDGERAATEEDMERHFWRQAEPDLDRLTLEMGKAERAARNPIPDWLLKAELMAFVRQRKRAAA